MTNDEAALAFGWYRKEGWGYPWRHNEQPPRRFLPDFNDLTTIVQECIRRDIPWSVGIQDGEPWAMVGGITKVILRPGKTSGQALRDALLSHMEQPI